MPAITFYKHEPIPMEMHKVKIVQQLHLLPTEQRLQKMQEAGFNTFQLHNKDIFLDMLTDSGVNAMSDRQQAAMLTADDAYAGSETFYKMQAKLQELFGIENCLPAHQGRACENILATRFVKPGNCVIMNYHFTTAKAHITRLGGRVEELVKKEGLESRSDLPFKGDIDLDALAACIQRETPENIPFVRLEAGTNLIGGQPISYANMKAATAICHRHSLLTVLDASLLQDNLYFIKTREPGMEDKSLREITRMIADLFGTEPIIPAAWNVFMNDLDAMLADPEGVAAGKPEAIASLFAGLTLSGIAMQVAKSSRPASCTEHLFSHVLDMTHHRYNGKFQSHGFQVAIGTLTMCAFFDEFFKMDLSTLDVDACVAAWPSLEAEQRRALDLFRDFPVPELGYTEITKKWNDAETVRVQLTRVKENWPAFKARLQAQCYPFEKMRALFAAAGAPTDPSQIGVSREQLRSMVDFTQLLRWRINLLDLAKRARIYDELVARVFGKGGAWEIA